MFQKFAKPLFYTIISLAIIGIAYRLFTDTQGFFKQVLFTVGFAALIIGVVYFFINRRSGGQSNEMKRYRKAVRQSKQKYGKTNSSSIAKKVKPSTLKQKVTSNKSSKSKGRKDVPHLRVIEGSKNKKKDRASL
ncbi:SA1362 family protein [Pontibacillus salicampi]|uniref:SA1362 family protein n=1 Tax=Pontibacillus salicampi TaxID=1449801 RepID=A0ABV6LJS8_9BACI